MTWLYLILASTFEVVWASAMKLSNGFTDLKWTIITILGMAASFGFLALTFKALPLSLSYPVWTGLGAVGSILVGFFFFHDAIPTITWFFILLLIIGIIGIQVTSGH